MKHELKITIVLLCMFLLTQFIGLYTAHSDPFSIQKEINGTIQQVPNPVLSWMNTPQEINQDSLGISFGLMVFSFIFAVLLLVLLIRFKMDSILKIWFFVVVNLALFLALTAILPEQTSFVITLTFSLILSCLKFFHRNFVIHNLTELLIYPGISSVFIPILDFWGVLLLLILISIYDMWAVWHSGVMQKMAKYQIDNLKIFSGFFIPYVSKSLKKKLKKLNKKQIKKKKIKVNIAILGGGDIVFPIITSGIILKTQEVFLPFGLKPFIGGIIPALFVIAGATLGLGLLLSFSQKKKFYPAMPFISAGIFSGIIISYIFTLF